MTETLALQNAGIKKAHFCSNFGQSYQKIDKFVWILLIDKNSGKENFDLIIFRWAWLMMKIANQITQFLVFLLQKQIDSWFFKFGNWFYNF